MTNSRIDKLQIRISEHVSTWIVQNMSSDANLLVTTIQSVQIAKDLSFAKVFITCANDADSACQVLNEKKKAIRQYLSIKMTLKKVPELTFLIDHKFAALQRINNMFDKNKL